MTFIKPHKNHSSLDFILGALVIVLLLGTTSLVVLYNHVVDLTHDIATKKAQLDSVGANNTVLSNQAMAMLGDGNITTFASAQGLVADNNPQYFEEPPARPSVAFNK